MSANKKRKLTTIKDPLSVLRRVELPFNAKPQIEIFITQYPSFEKWYRAFAVSRFPVYLPLHFV